ncbi:MAG TPA: carbonic anhydrase [Bryobacteraceae bacterium]|jgi:carbonic anhydrase|nr:carbonic anhydrase [Bryobacteraceae bacterium]
MEKLLAGYRRFRDNGWPEQRRIFETLAREGQAPKALVLGCIDSRVDPTRIFDTAPGEVLTVRNVAALVPPYEPDEAYHGTSAALEFGVRAMEVEHVIVLGHGMCGGVKALLGGAPHDKHAGFEFITPWMSLAQPVVENSRHLTDPGERQRFCEHAVIRISLANLMTFPWVAERVKAGKLALHGAWFDIRTGELMMLQSGIVFERASVTR